jgi:exonuclease SbcC
VADANRIAQQLATLPTSVGNVVAAAALIDVPVASLAPALNADRAETARDQATVPLPGEHTDRFEASFRESVAMAAAQLKDAQSILDGHARDLRSARDGLAKLAERQQQHESELGRTVIAPVRGIAAALQTMRTRAEDLQATLGAATLPETAHPGSEMTADSVIAYQSETANLLAAIDGLAEAARTRIDTLTRSAATEREAAAAALAEHELADFAALEQAGIDASTTWEIADRDARRARAEQPVAAALDGGIADATAALDVLHAVRKALSSAKFIDYVIARRSTALLSVASTLLGQLTVGGYGFAEEFKIIDRRTGVERDVKTLSGGETFLASLALALALVELAGRSGGRVDSLFLDEGFGSLDATILAEALDVLRGHVSTGRLVTVISHLHAVAADLDRVLLVTKTPAGSDLRWLEAAERERLLLDDVSAGLVS